MNAFPSSLQCKQGFAESLFVGVTPMQRPCLFAATRRVEVVDGMGFPVAAVGQVYELVSEKACADADPPHTPHKFTHFAHLGTIDSAAEPFKWLAASQWNSSIATVLIYYLVTGLLDSSAYARLSSLSDYRVRQTPPRPPVATTES